MSTTATPTPVTQQQQQQQIPVAPVAKNRASGLIGPSAAERAAASAAASAAIHGYCWIVRDQLCRWSQDVVVYLSPPETDHKGNESPYLSGGYWSWIGAKGVRVNAEQFQRASGVTIYPGQAVKVRIVATAVVDAPVEPEPPPCEDDE